MWARGGGTVQAGDTEQRGSPRVLAVGLCHRARCWSAGSNDRECP